MRRDDGSDAQAADNFGGKHDSGHANRRAGYTDPLGWAVKVARMGGTLAAGEGLLLVKHYEWLVQQAFVEGWHRGKTHGQAVVLPMVHIASQEEWETSDAKREMEQR